MVVAESPSTAPAAGARARPVWMRGYWQQTPCADFEVIPDATASLGASSSGHAGGAWSACTHISQYGLNIAPFFLRFLALQLKPQTALEFGCGLGTTADFLARFAPGGTRVTCIEPQAMHTEVYLRRNLPQRPTQLALNVFANDGDAGGAEQQRCAAAIPREGFDLVYSLEVAEHIPRDLHAALVPFLARSTRGLLVFSASPVITGHGHLKTSLRPRAEWQRLFEAAGLVYMPRLSHLASRAAYPERIDIARDVIVLRAASATHVDDTETASVLDRRRIFPFVDNLTHSPFSTHRHYLVDCGKVRNYQQVYEVALWPELHELAATHRCKQLGKSAG